MKLALSLLTAVAFAASIWADDLPHPLMRDFIGLNGHFAFKPDLHRPACQLVRNYPTVWDLGDDTALPAAFPFARNKEDERIWVAWSPTGPQREVVRDVRLPGVVSRAERMALKRGNPELTSITNDSNGLAQLPISESPLYLYIWLTLP